MLKSSISSCKPSISIQCPPLLILFICTHLRLSTPFHTFKLTELFGYESSLNATTGHNINYLFTSLNPPLALNIFSYTSRYGDSLPSLSTLFSASNWLERELAEMGNIKFTGKGDTRNLMLPYGDSSAPLQKNLPSIGLREIFYDASTDTIVTRPVSVQY